MIGTSSQPQHAQVAAYGGLRDSQRPCDVGLRQTFHDERRQLPSEFRCPLHTSGSVLVPQVGAVTAGVELQVLNPVVGSIAVDVVHDLIGSQSPSDGLLHDVAVFEHVALHTVLPYRAADITLRAYVVSEEPTLSHVRERHATSPAGKRVQPCDPARVGAVASAVSGQVQTHLTAAPFTRRKGLIDSAPVSATRPATGRVARGEAGRYAEGAAALDARLDLSGDVASLHRRRDAIYDFHYQKYSTQTQYVAPSADSPATPSETVEQ
jgi:hypothetical protein